MRGVARRGGSILLLLGALTACQDSRTFDKRYDDTASRIEQRAAKLDAAANEVAPAADYGDISDPPNAVGETRVK